MMSPWSIAVRLVDILLVVLGAALAHLLTRRGLPDVELFITEFNCALVLLLFPVFDLYRSWRGQSLFRLAWRALCAWTAVMLIGITLIFTLHQAAAVSRLWLGLAAVLTGGLLVLNRVLAYLAVQRLRRLGLNQKTVAIVGPEGHCREIIERVHNATYAGFKPTWLFDENGSEGHKVSGIEVTTRFHEFVDRVRRDRVDEIWLALPLSEAHTIHRFAREFRNDFVNLRFLPDIRSLSLLNRSVTEMIGMASVDVAVSPVSGFRLWPKNLFDRVFAALVLIAFMPLLVVVGILVKLSSPGPALFRQTRMGIDGHSFEILKFRTMMLHTAEQGILLQATRHDPRVTRLGAFLRRTSLDEFPQFFNVLMGHMSVVGPRPHAIEHDELYKDLVDGYMFRYRFKPGITGWAQVNGFRGETRKVGKMEARIKFDLFYMQNWSFWFDMKIVMLTISGGFVGRHAF